MEIEMDKKEELYMDARKTYESWLEDPYFDEDTKAELRGIAGDADEIGERFYRDLEFGTGGLRGIIGAGTNRMNIYTVRKATQGLANYIIKEHAEKKGVAIAFDSRNMSPEFAQEAALCLAANGIRAYIFPSLRPTPMLSFALRDLGCTAGIVVTASHNPPEYNGYKVYWEDGAQITFPKDREIIGEVNAITDYGQVKTMGQEAAEAAGLYQVIGPDMDDRYMEALKKLAIHPEIMKEEGRDLNIVYTPLHGTGNLPVRRVLDELGFTNVHVVEEQALPDGDFPTVSYPNPEDKNAFSLALKLAKEVDADLVLATDPDADRLGVYAKDSHTGEYRSFTGNMSGMLILEYILSQRKALGTLPENGAVVTTIVSGKMAREITKAYHVDLIETLTGFKYIGEQIKFFEQNHEHEYVFGYEESYGCLVGTHARDKDAVVAVMALCEAAAFCKHQGITLCDKMKELFDTYGYYKEGLCTVTLKGQDGAKKIASMMEGIRGNVPKTVGGLAVTQFRDYKEDVLLDCVNGTKTVTGLPRSNVLYFELEGGAWCCIRPSGTEPKIKFYIGVKGIDDVDAEKKLAELTEGVKALAR
jgi:phosphoglucomutase